MHMLTTIMIMIINVSYLLSGILCTAFGHLPSSSLIQHIPEIRDLFQPLTSQQADTSLPLPPLSTSRPDPPVLVSEGLPPIPTKMVGRDKSRPFCGNV